MLRPSSRSSAHGARREIDAVAMLTVYLVLLLAIPSGLTISVLGSLGRPSLMWGLVLMAWWIVSRLQSRTTAEAAVSQPVRFAVVAFLVIVLVSYAAAILRGQPDDQLSPALTAIVRLVSWMGVLLVVIDGIRTMKDLTTMVRRIGVGAGLLAALGLLQFLTGQALVDFFASIPGLSMAGGLGERAGVIRSSGTAIHPLEYATALNAALPLVIAGAISGGFRRRRSRRALWWWLPVALISISSLVAVSRSAIIGLIFAIVLMIPAIPRRYLPVTLGIGFVIAFVVFAATPGLLTTTIELFTGVASDPSTLSRTTALERVPEFMAVSPLIGSGFGLFLPRYYIFDNQWVLIAIELGVFGLVAFAGIFATAIWSALLAKRSGEPGARLLGHTLAVSMITVAILFAFFDGLSFPIAGGMLFLLAGLCGSVGAITRPEPAESVSRPEGSPAPRPDKSRRTPVVVAKALVSTGSTTPTNRAVPTDVAAVVVTYNSRQYVEALLDSLPDAFGQVRYSVVIVDNGSTDGTLELLERRSDCTLVRSTNDGFAAGINRAVRSSPDAPAILILNPDATVDRDAVPRMLACLGRPGVGIVAPRVREEDGRLSPTIRRGPTLGRVGGLSFTGLAAFTERIEKPREYESEHEVDWAVGAILLVDRQCFDALDGFDESYFLYSEETDFSLRARDAGWATVYTPNAEAMHVGGGSGESAATHTMQMLNRVRLYRRHVSERRAWLYFCMVILVELRRAILGQRTSWPTLRAMLRPSLRPPQLGASTSLVPK